MWCGTASTTVNTRCPPFLLMVAGWGAKTKRNNANHERIALLPQRSRAITSGVDDDQLRTSVQRSALALFYNPTSGPQLQGSRWIRER